MYKKNVNKTLESIFMAITILFATVFNIIPMQTANADTIVFGKSGSADGQFIFNVLGLKPPTSSRECFSYCYFSSNASA